MMRASVSIRVSMHLLVLSAFRQARSGCPGDRAVVESQCTFWCSVLSDAKARGVEATHVLLVSMHLLVLSAFRREAPPSPRESPVSMHLLVLSAFRQNRCIASRKRGLRRVSMHLLVLSAFRHQKEGGTN